MVLVAAHVLIMSSIQYVGTTTVPNICRAGGSGPNDFICQGVSDAYVTLIQYPQDDADEDEDEYDV
jgi:hypothetical protein